MLPRVRRRVLVYGGRRSFRSEDGIEVWPLSRFATIGSLMGNLVGGKMAIQGRIARAAYMSLYRMHILNVHGGFRGVLQIIGSKINKVTRPAIKLH